MAKKKKEILESEVAPKVIKETKSTVKLVSFTVKATIPVGAYANICPEISVDAPTLEEAKAFVLPQIEGLFTQYLNFLERPKTPPVVVENTYVASTNYDRALSAITNAKSPEAIAVIKGQIEKSVKLSPSEKTQLLSKLNG